METLLSVITERCDNANGESVECDELDSEIMEIMKQQGYDPEGYCYWIKSSVMRDWCRWAIPGFGGRDGRGYKAKITSMIKVGALKHIQMPYEKYPTKKVTDMGRPVHGFMWNNDPENKQPEKAVPFMVIKQSQCGK
jgi:hypothetical protein